MGVLNLTPDSFSDGGRYANTDQAVAHGLVMAQNGASIIDVGGESTRPGSHRVSPAEQIKRVAGPIAALRDALDRNSHQDVAISIDTTHATVAEAALDAGAGMLNDVSAGREDPALLALAAERNLPIALMHMRGQPGNMQDDPHYQRVVDDVLDFLTDRADAAIAAGIRPEQIWIDPGIGFGKTLEHNLQLLGHLERFVATGYRVLLGASRKRFIPACMSLGASDLPTDRRMPGSIAAALLGVAAGVHALRVHDVPEHAQALAVWQAVKALN